MYKYMIVAILSLLSISIMANGTLDNVIDKKIAEYKTKITRIVDRATETQAKDGKYTSTQVHEAVNKIQVAGSDLQFAIVALLRAQDKNTPASAWRKYEPKFMPFVAEQVAKVSALLSK